MSTKLPQCLTLKEISLNAHQQKIELKINILKNDQNVIRTGAADYGLPQQQTHWCWIAVATLVGDFYKNKKSHFSQSWLYERIKKLKSYSCDENYRTLPQGDKCNKDGDPWDSLGNLGYFAGMGMDSLRPGIMSCVAELKAKRPLVIGVKFSNGIKELDGATAHAMVICGENKSNKGRWRWEIYDPWYGTQKYFDVETFPKGLYGDARAKWWFTCFTKDRAK